jgi:hypothetical protein
MRIPFIFTPATLVVMMTCCGRYSTAHAECLSSANAVWAAHPGAHATWRLRLPGHEGVKCWFARGGGTKIEDYATRDSVRGVDLLNAIPLPSPRPGFQDARGGTDRASLPTLSAGEVRSILVWGRPVEIDATWDEMFVARELHVK